MAPKESKKATYRKRAASTSSSSLSVPSLVTKRNDEGGGEIRIAFIDSERMMDKNHRCPRSYSLVKPPKMPSSQPSDRHRSSSSSSSRSRNSSRSSCRSDSIYCSICTGGIGWNDVTRVKVIEFNPNTGMGVAKRARIFVFDSKKHCIEEMSSHKRRHRGSKHAKKSGNWTQGGLSHVVFTGGREPSNVYQLLLD